MITYGILKRWNSVKPKEKAGSVCPNIGSICLKYFIILFKIQQVYFFVSNVYGLFLNDEIKGSDCCLQAVLTNDTCESGLALLSIREKPSCLLFFLSSSCGFVVSVTSGYAVYKFWLDKCKNLVTIIFRQTGLFLCFSLNSCLYL